MWFALEAIAARAFPGYSYARNYISDLGIPIAETLPAQHLDSPLAWVMNFDLIAHGMLFLVGAVCIFRSAPGGSARNVFLGFAALHAAGSVLVGTVHESARAAADGTLVFHRLGAGLAIYGANIAIVVAGTNASGLGASAGFRVASILLGATGIGCISLLAFAPGPIVPAGALERAGVYPIMLWEIVTG